MIRGLHCLLPWKVIVQNSAHPLALLLLQVVTIIVVARVLGYFFKKIGQPSVIGEIVAGILLGPSFAGACLPQFSAFCSRYNRWQPATAEPDWFDPVYVCRRYGTGFESAENKDC